MRGMVHHRWLALGVLTGALALAAGPAAQAGIDPPPGELQRLQAEQLNTTAAGPTPDAFERAVLRSQQTSARMKDSHERGTSTPSTTAGPTPDAFERAVLRSQSETTVGDSHERATSTPSHGYTPAALRALGERWQAYADSVAAEDSGYTPAALRALGERWEAYAESANGSSQASASTISDSHSRSDLPSTSPSGTSVDETGISWTDVGIGALLGIALAGLGVMAAFAMRGHGRVPQS